MLFKRRLPPELKRSLDVYINIRYDGETTGGVCFESAAPTLSAPAPPMDRGYAKPHAPMKSAGAALHRMAECSAPALRSTPSELDLRLKTLDESFQEMLLRKIDEKGMRDSECYKRAGLDRKLFSKIRSNPQYKPKKTTAIAFCMALELEYDEAIELLQKAGYALSRSSKFDVIAEYFLMNRRYSIHELNLALYEYDQPLLN